MTREERHDKMWARIIKHLRKHPTGVSYVGTLRDAEDRAAFMTLATPDLNVTEEEKWGSPKVVIRIKGTQA